MYVSIFVTCKIIVIIFIVRSASISTLFPTFGPKIITVTCDLFVLYIYIVTTLHLPKALFLGFHELDLCNNFSTDAPHCLRVTILEREKMKARNEELAMQ